MSSREFIDNIENNNNLEAEAHFTNIMIDKVGSSLEERRYDLANDLVNEKKEMKGTRAITGDEGEDIFGRDKATMGERDAIFKKYGFSVPKDVLDAQKKREQERRDRRNAPKSKPKDADPNRSDAKAKRKGDLPKRTGDGGVAADMEIAGGKAPSKSNQELDIGAGPKKPSKKPQVGTGDQHGRSKTKKPKVVQPGDTKHPLDTSDIESGATAGVDEKLTNLAKSEQAARRLQTERQNQSSASRQVGDVLGLTPIVDLAMEGVRKILPQPKHAKIKEIAEVRDMSDEEFKEKYNGTDMNRQDFIIKLLNELKDNLIIRKKDSAEEIADLKKQIESGGFTFDTGFSIEDEKLELKTEKERMTQLNQAMEEIDQIKEGLALMTNKTSEKSAPATSVNQGPMPIPSSTKRLAYTQQTRDILAAANGAI